MCTMAPFATWQLCVWGPSSAHSSLDHRIHITFIYGIYLKACNLQNQNQEVPRWRQEGNRQFQSIGSTQVPWGPDQSSTRLSTLCPSLSDSVIHSWNIYSQALETEWAWGRQPHEPPARHDVSGDSESLTSWQATEIVQLDPIRKEQKRC